MESRVTYTQFGKKISTREPVPPGNLSAERTHNRSTRQWPSCWHLSALGANTFADTGSRMARHNNWKKWVPSNWEAYMSQQKTSVRFRTNPHHTKTTHTNPQTQKKKFVLAACATWPFDHLEALVTAIQALRALRGPKQCSSHRPGINEPGCGWLATSATLMHGEVVCPR